MFCDVTRSVRVCVLLPTLCASMLAAQAVQAEMITFDDLGPSSGGTHMPGIYNNLRWGLGIGDWHSMTLASDPSNTFLALSGNATFVGALLGGEDFYFNGADFWSRRGLDANGDFYFFLYNNGVTVYNGFDDPDGRQRFTNVHQTFSPGYTGPIDGFAIGFDSDLGDWDHLAMDNLSIQTVPTPSAAGAFLGCAMLALRRKRRGAAGGGGRGTVVVYSVRHASTNAFRPAAARSVMMVSRRSAQARLSGSDAPYKSR